MRFMILVKASKESEAGMMPSEQILTEMGRFNEELAKARVLLGGRGAPSDLQGHAHQILRRKKNRDRGAVCRD